LSGFAWITGIDHKDHDNLRSDLPNFIKMYFRQLYQHNKAWFVVVAAFALGQVLINLKHGMVFSPFYHYGMYSEVMKPRESYPVYEIVVNEQSLRAKDFTPQRWDKIVQPVQFFARHQEWNGYIFSEMNRLSGISDTARYFNHTTKREFYRWYERYLATELGTRVHSLNIQLKNYTPGR
jgi:hypothetical protein